LFDRVAQLDAALEAAELAVGEQMLEEAVADLSPLAYDGSGLGAVADERVDDVNRDNAKAEASVQLGCDSERLSRPRGRVDSADDRVHPACLAS
jgi:hypothetical protein